MKKLLKYIIPILIFLAFSTPALAEWWAKNATQSLVTNDGSGFANADIHVRNCYLGLGTTPCGSAGSGSVTSFSFTNTNGFSGSVTNPTTTPNLTLTTSLTTSRIPFIQAGGALNQNTLFNFNIAGESGELHVGSTNVPSGRVVDVVRNVTGSTQVNGMAVAGRDTGTYNTTGSVLTSYGGYFDNTSTRSAGANTKTNVGIYANATGGQNNYGLIVGNGASGFGTGTPGAWVDINNDSLGTTPSDTLGLVIKNSIAASVGAQQISPAVRWHGSGWKTNATAGAQSVDFRAYVLPVQGAGTPQGIWKLEAASDSPTGLYFERFGVTTQGEIRVSGNAGLVNEVLTSGGAGAPATWTAPFGLSDGSCTQASGNTVNLGGSCTSNVDIDGLTNDFSLTNVLNLTLQGTNMQLGDNASTLSSSGVIYSGVYTPTPTHATDLTGVTLSPAQYMRIGNTVTVSGIISFDFALTASTGSIDFDVPTSISAFGNIYEASGTSVGQNSLPATVGRIIASIGDMNVHFEVNTSAALGASGVVMSYHYTYQIIP